MTFGGSYDETDHLYSVYLSRRLRQVAGWTIAVCGLFPAVHSAIHMYPLPHRPPSFSPIITLYLLAIPTPEGLFICFLLHKLPCLVHFRGLVLLRNLSKKTGKLEHPQVLKSIKPIKGGVTDAGWPVLGPGRGFVIASR